MKTDKSRYVLNLFFSKLTSLFRFGSWWHYKIPPLIAVFFFAQKILESDCSARVLLNLFLLIIWMIAAAAFGYFVNDWCDIEEDRLSGKRNEVSLLSLPVRLLIAITLFSATLLIQFFLNGIESVPFLLSVLHLLLFLLYSVPPFRLKQFLLPSLLCDSLYAHLLPVVIVFTSVLGFENYFLLFTVVCVWQLILGIKNILLHHILDRKNDVLSGNRNLANQFRPVLTLKIVNGLLVPLDLFFALLFFALVSFPLVFIVIGLVIFRLFLVYVVWGNKNLLLNIKLPYLLLNGVYEGYVPFISVLLFCTWAKISVLLGLIYLLIFPKFTYGITHDLRSLFNYLKSKWGR